MSEIMSNDQSFKMEVLKSKNLDDDDLFKENLSPCSKKIKLFEQIEKQFLSTGSININNILKDQINEIKPFNILHEESKKMSESTKDLGLVVTEKNNTGHELAWERRINENVKELKTMCETNQTKLKIKNNDNGMTSKESTIQVEQKNETQKEVQMTKSEIEPDCKDFENILDENMKEQDNEATDVENEQDEIEDQLNFEEKEIKKELDEQLDFKERYINKEEEVDEKGNGPHDDIDKEERDFDDNENSDNGEEEEDAEEDEDKTDTESEEESKKPLSFLEKRRLNKMKMIGQMSNLLDTARSKMKQISQKLEKPKIELNSNPRKRKRSDLIDQSTRELIKDITPVRRSSRQVERKYYSEGVIDPELINLLNKLEKYARLNRDFKPSQDESSYEENFLGFKQDASRRALYPEDYNPKRRRYRRVVHRSGRSVPVPAMDPNEITDDVLSKVVTHVSAKVYSQAGSTCHQCRQKTLDTKTFCRSGECTGVRGQFCGVCLLNRYGEDIVKALLDENWSCPPCRDICNCSICRNRKGLPPTGIMTPLALGKGFDSVKDYLQEAEKDLEFEEY
ncbi:hypothetical protein WDU94_011759 [Cyamophila willieti]